MAITDPFPGNIETLLQDPIQHLFTVTAIPPTGPEFDLVPIGRLNLTYDMGWSPYAQVNLAVRTPQDAAQEAALDARLGTRLRLKMGYRHAGRDYLATMATLRLQSADTPYPGMTTDLTAMGAEMIPQEQHTIKEGDSATDGYKDLSGLEPFLRSFINRGYEPGPKPVIISTIPAAPWWIGLVSDYMGNGETYWSAMEGPANAAGVRVYDDGSGTWHLDRLPVLSATIAASLTTGPRGTVTSADRGNTRADWYNRVTVQYDWTSQATGNPNTVSGSAWVKTGPHAAVAPNIKEFVQFRQAQATTEVATARAAGLLRKFLLRGRSRSVTAAAAYWLRPGHTIKVRLGAGAWETVLVSAVTFSPLTGSMAVSTIRPEDYETGE